MAQELFKGTTYTTTSPGNNVTAANLNAIVDSGQVGVGSIVNRAAKVTPVGADLVAISDSADPSNTFAKKVRLDALIVESVNRGIPWYATDTGAANAYAIALTPAATTYTAGMAVRFKVANSNTGASTLNVNALGAKNLLTRAGANPAANDILAGQIIEAIYDGTSFYLTQVISAAEITAAHLAEVNRESVHQYAADSGAANAYAVTLSPAATAYTAGMVVRFKAANANTGASTLNVNAIGAINLKRPNGAALAANDILASQLVEVVYDGTNFQLIGVRSPDFTSTGAIPANSAATAIAHGLGAKPTRLRVCLMNNTAAADNGYAQNDEVDISGTSNANNGNMAFTACADATNITVARNNSGGVQVVPKTGGALGAITTANWVIKVYATL